MGKRLVGGILGLVVGWIVAATLQRAVGWIGVNSFLVILMIIVGALSGFNMGRLVGAVIGAMLGALLGAMAIRLLFLLLKLATMVLGAAVGWKLTAANN